MKKAYILAAMCIVLIAFSVSISYAGEPYAPKLTPPEGIKPGTPDYLGVMMINNAQVPDRASVEVPPYPEAKIIQANKGTEMTANGQKYHCLNYMKMLSTDDGEKIASFYKGKLKGYNFKNEFGGMIRVFWKGADDVNTMDITQMCTTPNMVITGPLDSYKKMMPGVQSVIEIGYK
jgi:hypothetical protein